MANKVFANGREVSCKAANGKSVAAFPDVCLSPPSPPAGPVPVPYPNTGYARDTSQGSKSVRITGQEVMLRNSSYFRRSTGDEAATRALGMGVVSHTITGKVYFTSWSMNVKIEGENAVRHLDLTTHNHASFPGNTPPWLYQDGQANAAIPGCEQERDSHKYQCAGLETMEQQCNDSDCKTAKACLLVTQNQGVRKGKESAVGCCPGYQAHHLVEAHCFYKRGQRGKANERFVPDVNGKESYRDRDAPCVCASGARHTQQHGTYHAVQQAIEAAHHENNESWNYKDAREAGVLAHSIVNPHCNQECIRNQLDRYHRDQCGFTDDTQLRIDDKAATQPVGELDDQARAKVQAHTTAITGHV